MKNLTKLGAVSALSLIIGASAAFAENIKVAMIEGLSGPFAANGTNSLHIMEFAADYFVNSKGGLLDGRNIEVVPFDSKGSPKEALIQLQVAIDQGIRFISQGNGSAVANALTEAVDKHNKRNPDSRVLFLNYAAVDPALTNDKCNFWHFRFDANANIKMDAITDVIAANQDIKKMYVIGQDYSFGKAVAAAAVSNMTEKRPDVEFVGNELHPIGKVKDFTPYTRKIVAAGTDAVITGNWGADMLGLGKSLVENGYEGPLYTYYAVGTGITGAFGEAGKGTIQNVGVGEFNPPASEESAQLVRDFKAKFPDSDFTQTNVSNSLQMLSEAIAEAGTADDVVAVGFALEGMEMDNFWGGKMVMRESDHQLIQDVHIHTHTNEGIEFDYDNSGYGVLTQSTVEMAGLDSATTCEMTRP